VAMPFLPEIRQHVQQKNDAQAIQYKKNRHGRWTSFRRRRSEEGCRLQVSGFRFRIYNLQSAPCNLDSITATSWCAPCQSSSSYRSPL
jgi:hypothetical protein